MRLPKEIKASALARLKRIEGQIRGIQRMLDEDKECYEVIDQLKAVRAALDSAMSAIVLSNIEACLGEKINVQEMKDLQRSLKAAVGS